MRSKRLLAVSLFLLSGALASPAHAAGPAAKMPTNEKLMGALLPLTKASACLVQNGQGGLSEAEYKRRLARAEEWHSLGLTAVREGRYRDSRVAAQKISQLSSTPCRI